MGESSSSSDSFSILLATDIHLGCHEKDAVRRDDSFNTFEEILQVAQDKNVDFILLGGDLFHDNKPSPQALFKCITLLRKYCMGDKPINVEFLSDQRENFRHCVNPIVNYEDPNLNISAPVFSIHGNHDDPAGVGLVSSLDILSVSGLVNYFGKWTDLKQVKINPILLGKGKSKIALYGLSYIKDARLARLFLESKVDFLRPDSDPDNWFNICVLHQNRADRGEKNYVQEAMLPSFLDLVVWGHEHECRIDLEYNAEKEFYVTQPGSPVATSLCDGEAVTKHVAILKIWKKKMKMEKIKLKTVRPFVFNSINLSSELKNTRVLKRDKKSQVHDLLTGIINDMLDSARDQLSGHMKQPTLPLLRLRVEYSNDDEFFNQIRFGQEFSESVANPMDMILLRRSTAGKRAKKGDFVDEDAMDIAMESTSQVKNDDSDQTLGAVLEAYFANSAEDKHLSVLSVRGMGEVVNRFICMDDKEGLEALVKHQQTKSMNYLKNLEVVDDATIDEQLREFRNLRLAKLEEEDREIHSYLESSGLDATIRIQPGYPQGVLSDDDDDELLPEQTLSVSRGRGRGRGSTTSRPARGRGSRGGRGSRSKNTSIVDHDETNGNNPLNISRTSVRTKRSQPSVADMFSFSSTAKKQKIHYISDSD